MYFESTQNTDVVLPKKEKKAYSAVSQGNPQPLYYYILAVTLKKKIINDTEVCCCTPQDECRLFLHIFVCEGRWCKSLLHIFFSFFLCVRGAFCWWLPVNPATMHQQYRVPLAKDLLYILPDGSLFSLNQQWKYLLKIVPFAQVSFFFVLAI